MTVMVTIEVARTWSTTSCFLKPAPLFQYPWLSCLCWCNSFQNRNFEPHVVHVHSLFAMLYRL